MPGRVPAERLGLITRLIGRLQAGETVDLPPGLDLGRMIVAATIGQLAGGGDVPDLPAGSHFRVVQRARAYIEAHLDNPIAIDDLVAAARTSRRTLHRAFIEVLGETPHTYVLKLRLNRIRSDLATPHEAQRTVTTVSHRWGIAELGKLAARYRAQFGELPSETLARHGAATPARSRPAPPRI
jgi:AraC-like DNA-binding protein